MRDLLKKTIALVLAMLMPAITSAQTGTSTTASPSVNKFYTSVDIGPVAVSLQMTNPITAQTGVVWNTLHIEARDDTQTPPFHGNLDAVGQAADAATLFGGFLPCAVIIQKDLASGLSLAQAEADCYAKTKVTVTSFKDDLIEYTLLLAFVALASAALLVSAGTGSSTVNSQLSAMVSKMESSLAAVGSSDVSTDVSALQTSLTAVGGGSTIP